MQFLFIILVSNHEHYFDILETTRFSRNFSKLSIEKNIVVVFSSFGVFFRANYERDQWKKSFYCSYCRARFFIPTCRVCDVREQPTVPYTCLNVKLLFFESKRSAMTMRNINLILKRRMCYRMIFIFKTFAAAIALRVQKDSLCIRCILKFST